ncbi:hypothetical protein [Haloferula sp. BvORR071]|uniref:hypothetical protein n=1 Tax=Haloferula sp. BvORR071 TaxID=1396141 RepID=UPI000558D233|nr:hypothetical protein [Haloferula sp. BvORR071]
MSTNPEPPPGATKKHPPLPATVRWMSIIIALILLAAIAYPSYLLMAYQRAAASRQEAMDNIRAVGFMMLEFDAEYGSYPSAAAAAEVKSATGSELSLGSASSNQLFRQLLAGGGGKSGKPFWAKTANSPGKPDDNFGSDACALVAGGVSFAYIVGLNSKSDQATPLLMAPLLPGKHEFDPKPFGGHAVILLNAGHEAKSYPIDKDGHVIIGGMDIFDPRQTFWHGKAPDIKWPE